MKTSLPSTILWALFLGVFGSAHGAEAAVTAAAPDAPWKIYQTVQASYPPRLMLHGVTHGEARVRVSVSATGQLNDALIVACSHRDFGDEALRTVQRWRYEPERVNGKPIGIVADVTFSFEVNGPVAIEKRAPAPNEERYAPLDPFAYQAEGLKSVDRIPAPTRIVAPVYPQEWSDKGIEGTATVDFFIDESGQTRIPVVTSADHPLLGASAIAAVSQWRFEPATRRGQLVLVHAQQVFFFQPEKK